MNARWLSWVLLALLCPTAGWGFGRLEPTNLTVQGALNTCSATNTGNAYSCALDPVLPSYVSLASYTFVPGNANTGSATINFGPSALTLKKRAGGSLVDLVAGDLEAGAPTTCFYTGTYCVVTTPAGSLVRSVSNSDGTLTISPTTGAVVASLNLAHSNAWTAVQTITLSGAGPVLTGTVVDAGTGIDNGVTLTLANTDTTANNRVAITFSEASGTAARYGAKISDHTGGSVTAELCSQTKQSGTLAERACVGAGFYTSGATGGDKGANTINATTVYAGGQIAAQLPTGTEMGLGNSGSATRIRSSLAVPASLSNGDAWFACTGTTPTRQCVVSIRDTDGVTYSQNVGAAH